jgi:hypothetical protein
MREARRFFAATYGRALQYATATATIMTPRSKS